MLSEMLTMVGIVLWGDLKEIFPKTDGTAPTQAHIRCVDQIGFPLEARMVS